MEKATIEGKEIGAQKKPQDLTKDLTKLFKWTRDKAIGGSLVVLGAAKETIWERPVKTGLAAEAYVLAGDAPFGKSWINTVNDVRAGRDTIGGYLVEPSNIFSSDNLCTDASIFLATVALGSLCTYLPLKKLGASNKLIVGSIALMLVLASLSNENVTKAELEEGLDSNITKITALIKGPPSAYDIVIDDIPPYEPP